MKVLAKINEINLLKSSDNELQAMSQRLIERAGSGESLDALQIEAYALVREAAERTIGLASL